MPVCSTDLLIENRVRAIRDYHATHRFARAELDVSGGVDSAVMLGIVCRALGPEHVTAVFTGITSSQDSLDRARAAAATFEARLIEVEVGEIFSKITRHLLEAATVAGHDRAAIESHLSQDPAVLGSFRSCLRAPIGRALNRMLQGGVRHGTGNECEDRFLRFYQKGGDGEVDSNPIAMLSKGEVFQLGRALGVPRHILDAVPSPDLHGTGALHTDEDELAATYGVAWTYSKIEFDTGNYSFVGTIERMSRLLDEPGVEGIVFGKVEPDDEALDAIITRAQARTFTGFATEAVREFIRSARHIERVTRHKHNPNCPTFGDRATLVESGILTNELPLV